ncbi:hypothetical protein ACFX11_000730 [Malus domestica]
MESDAFSNQTPANYAKTPPRIHYTTLIYQFHPKIKEIGLGFMKNRTNRCGAVVPRRQFINLEVNSIDYHHQSTPPNLKNKAQAVVEVSEFVLRSNREHPFLGFLTDRRQFQVFPGRFGLRPKYESYSPCCVGNFWS